MWCSDGAVVQGSSWAEDRLQVSQHQRDGEEKETSPRETHLKHGSCMGKETSTNAKRRLPPRLM